jgi:hypothetical protein
MWDIGLKQEEKELLRRLVEVLERVTNEGIVIRIDLGNKSVDDIRK